MVLAKSHGLPTAPLALKDHFGSELDLPGWSRGGIQQSGRPWPAGLDKVKELTPLAVQTRYPGFNDPIDESEVDEAIGQKAIEALFAAEV